MRMARLFGRWSRAATLAVLAGASAALAGCDDFMEVTNPGAIEKEQLNDPDYIELMVHGVMGDFQPAFAWTAVWSGAFVDELYNHHGFSEYPLLERREVDPGHGTYTAGIYNGLHRARFQADSAVARMKTLLADSAGQDLRIARVLAYGGYSWLLLGEQMCESPINRSEQYYTSEELWQEAIKRFDEAIAVAGAAKTAAARITDAKARAAYAAGADSVANFARVGAARASLNLGSFGQAAFKQKAVDYASQVTPAYASPGSQGFEFRAHFLNGNSFAERRRISNPAWEFISAGKWFSLGHTPFENLRDPRVPKTATPITVTGGQRQYVANSPSGYSTYDGSLVGKPIKPETSIRIASALEARYIIAEVQGMNASNLAFVNERRAIGGDGALPAGISQAEYLAALRDQRARDFYIDTHRLGDLRRYKQEYGVDLFPSGPYPDNPSIDYGTQTCFPVPLSERN